MSDFEIVIGCDATHPDRRGGQHVAKPCTGVRVLHRPSGLAVTCTSERSQHGNRERAMAELRRLLQPTLSPDDLAALRVIADLWRARAPNHRTGHENRALAVLDRLLEQSK